MGLRSSPVDAPPVYLLPALETSFDRSKVRGSRKATARRPCNNASCGVRAAVNHARKKDKGGRPARESSIDSEKLRVGCLEHQAFEQAV